MVFRLALILTFSPGEKEQPWSISGIADDGPANPVAGFQVSRRTILLLLWGEGWDEGGRASHFSIKTSTQRRQGAKENPSGLARL